jgi:cytochrome b subunit of formate dehydrogenase
MSNHIVREKETVKRHSIIELVEHWAIALSGLSLVFTGMFQLPVAKRYFVTELPGMAWAGDFIFTLTLHYAASVVFVAAALFHVVYHGILGHRGMIPGRGDLTASVAVIKSFFGKGEEPPFHKYLPEQRLAYVGMAIIIAGLIISGLIKVYKNIYAPNMSITVVWWATMAHNFFFAMFVLAFVAHMAALIIKPNRPMVRGILTGEVRLEYARHRHPLWIRELEDGDSPSDNEDREGPEIEMEEIEPASPDEEKIAA